jgi:hypothetical protein
MELELLKKDKIIYETNQEDIEIINDIISDKNSNEKKFFRIKS